MKPLAILLVLAGTASADILHVDGAVSSRDIPWTDAGEVGAELVFDPVTGIIRGGKFFAYRGDEPNGEVFVPYGLKGVYDAATGSISTTGVGCHVTWCDSSRGWHRQWDATFDVEDGLATWFVDASLPTHELQPWQYSGTFPVEITTSVPEPSAVGLMLIGMMVVLRRRQDR